ncbi:DUF2959 domain-containing protein [Agarivorans sp. MS3-6]|uniref:DUF2959 domain-containing protein n=1 Tax=Agarivorans sp. TSD2052 TaxID=2937286 RepID=UPI00200BC2B0|nr:DUF2959 domain-containing protein [Agarivorans sp. TSD2052]UPW16926.1 DUF2959 domain-containing protein [Agarivorans sp. TSD2052]
MKIFTSLVLVVFLFGCESTYYSAMEKVGYHKREILVDRVEEAQESQQDAQQQFTSALEQLKSLTQFDGGDLEAVYDDVNEQYQDSKAAAETVSERIDEVDSVAEALFDEWQEELEQYQSTSLKAESKQQLNDTRKRYAAMLKAMRRAEAQMQPVLSRLNDNQLYLKHNLNARAIGAVGKEFTRLEQEVADVIQQMSKAIAESDKFIATMK